MNQQEDRKRTPLYNVFQPGLVRGAAKLPFAPHKRYFYVEHPIEGWRVYLRSCAFLHEADAPLDYRRFLVVKRYGGDAKKKTWEPPKGQMEGKDGNRPRTPILRLLEENVRREVEEEAKIKKIQLLHHTGLVFQSQEKDYPANHYFQYHIWQGFVGSDEINKAANEFQWLQEHPAAFARLRKDRREKDALAWFDPKHTLMMGKWSPSIVAMYLSSNLELIG
jgi:8-oxo-dGTP pyrophosphatase MutT (NUDIX family)